MLAISEQTRDASGIALFGYRDGLTVGWVSDTAGLVVMPHEVGHMFGAGHNREIAGHVDEGFEYGNRNLKDGYTTVMGFVDLNAFKTVEKKAKLCSYFVPEAPEINCFSTPRNLTKCGNRVTGSRLVRRLSK